MQSPTISQSINIYVFTINITINQHICISQHRLHHIIQLQHTISHIPSKWENTTYHDIITFNDSFTHLHIIISNYTQEIYQVFDHKITFDKFVYHFAKPNHYQKKTKFDSTKHRLITLKHLNRTLNTQVLKFGNKP